MGKYQERQRPERSNKSERRGERPLPPLVTEVEPRRRFVCGDTVRFERKDATVIEVVPPQGRPTSKVDVRTLRPMESYVVEYTKGGEKRFAWPACHEIEA